MLVLILALLGTCHEGWKTRDNPYWEAEPPARGRAVTGTLPPVLINLGKAKKV